MLVSSSPIPMVAPACADLTATADGLWKRMFGTEPMPYLPHHPEYGERIKVRYFVYEVL